MREVNKDLVITEALRIFAASEATDDISLSQLLGDREEWYNWHKSGGKKPKTVIVHDILSPYIPEKKSRIEFLNHIYGNETRRITSTKQLRYAEYSALFRANAVQMIPKAVEEFENVRKKT